MVDPRGIARGLNALTDAARLEHEAAQAAEAARNAERFIEMAEEASGITRGIARNADEVAGAAAPISRAALPPAAPVRPAAINSERGLDPLLATVSDSPFSARRAASEPQMQQQADDFAAQPQATQQMHQGPDQRRLEDQLNNSGPKANEETIVDAEFEEIHPAHGGGGNHGGDPPPRDSNGFFEDRPSRGTAEPSLDDQIKMEQLREIRARNAAGPPAQTEMERIQLETARVQLRSARAGQIIKTGAGLAGAAVLAGAGYFGWNSGIVQNLSERMASGQAAGAANADVAKDSMQSIQEFSETGTVPDNLVPPGREGVAQAGVNLQLVDAFDKVATAMPDVTDNQLSAIQTAFTAAAGPDGLSESESQTFANELKKTVPDDAVANRIMAAMGVSAPHSP